MWLSMLGLYAWTLPAGACFASTLSLLGLHLLARERLLQSFCVSQGAVLGTLLGIGLAWPPTLLALATGAFVFLFSETLFKSVTVIREALFGTLFIALLALSYMMSVLFPQLEQHMASIFFGDLVTMSTAEAQWVLVLGGLICAILWAYWKPISSQSFDIALYGDATAQWLSSSHIRRLFSTVTLIAVVLSVQWLGFLFTVACLYLPAVISNVRQKGRFSQITMACIWTPALSVMVGFCLSLIFPVLPSVPTIIVIMGGLSLLNSKVYLGT